MNYDRKTILKPELYNGFFQPPHDCLYLNDLQAYEIDTNELVINHYTNRCKSYFFNQKLKNKVKMQNHTIEDRMIYDLLTLGNDAEDTKKVVQRFVPALRKKMGLINA